MLLSDSIKADGIHFHKNIFKHINAIQTVLSSFMLYFSQKFTSKEKSEYNTINKPVV